MKICIVGSGGYLGSALSQACRARQYELQLVSSRTHGFDLGTGLLDANFEIRPGTDIVYYLAQSPHYRQVPEFSAHLLSVNCVAGVQAAQAAVRAGAKRFIYASTGNVYAPTFEPLAETDPVQRDNWYSLSKVIAEDALALFAAKMDVTLLRIFGIYGPGQTDKLVPMLIDRVRQGRQIFADGNPNDPDDMGGLKCSLIYIDDAVEAILKLATVVSPLLLNLAGSCALSVAEIASAVGAKLNLPVDLNQSEKCRRGDLVADIGLLTRFVAPQFTPFETALNKVLASTG